MSAELGKKTDFPFELRITSRNESGAPTMMTVTEFETYDYSTGGSESTYKLDRFFVGGNIEDACRHIALRMNTDGKRTPVIIYSGERIDRKYQMSFVQELTKARQQVALDRPS